ncbi:MAG: COX15/CtaA family protein [Myxococcota bacterium]
MPMELSTSEKGSHQRLANFAWATLAYNVAVVLWGAYVRATGSGAGCGSHWPTCRGEVIPREPTAATLIEFTHRATSGIALLMVVWLLIRCLRELPAGHPGRRGAVASMFFMLTEAAVGAGLVLFELVAENKSMARGMFMAVHLVNTFLLLASMALTAWWSSGRPAVSLRRQGPRGVFFISAVMLLLVLGVSGAITALGDTLFPAGSLEEGLAMDLSATAHLFVRLRLIHPFLAAGVGLYLVVGVATLQLQRGEHRGLARSLMVFLTLQMIAGPVNVLLLAPVWLQLVHLLLSDLLWLNVVLLGAGTLARR